ncbi:MAG: cell division ATPase MinD [Nanoarchaeota archaeon]
MTTFIAIAGGKGGSGKTTVSINLSSALEIFGRETVIVDANLSKPNLGLCLGLTNIPKSVHTAVAGQHRLDEAIFYHPSGIKVIPCHTSMDYLRDSQYSAALHHMLNDLAEKTELVLIDTASGFSDETMNILQAVDQVILVTTPTLASVTDCLKTLRLCQEKSIQVMGVIINKVHESNHEMDVDNIHTILEVPVIGVIPYCHDLMDAQQHKYPVVYTHEHSKSGIAFKKLAANLIGEEYHPDVSADESLLSYILQKTGLRRNMREEKTQVENNEKKK